jgi:adenylate cyclase, class 2
MAIEIEKKYRICQERAQEIIKTLKEFSAEFVGEDNEENIILSGETLRKKGAVLRIRRIGETTIVTFKQRIENSSDIKHQIEEEVEVSDAKSMMHIFAELGFESVLIYEKRRRKWRFRSVEVVIDELPFGLYMEIEGMVTAIREAELILGIEDHETEHLTYPSLTAEHGKKRNGVIEARFGDANKVLTSCS